MAKINKTTDSFCQVVGKSNSCSLLVGIKISAATLQISVENPQKIKKDVCLLTQQYHLFAYAQGTQHLIPQVTCSALFNAAVFTIARI